MEKWDWGTEVLELWFPESRTKNIRLDTILYLTIIPSFHYSIIPRLSKNNL
jgi:hypothetical protein